MLANNTYKVELQISFDLAVKYSKIECSLVACPHLDPFLSGDVSADFIYVRELPRYLFLRWWNSAVQCFCRNQEFCSDVPRN